MVLKDCSKGRVYLPGSDEYWSARVNFKEDSSIELYLNKYDGYGTEYGTRVDFLDDVVGVVETDSEVHIVKNDKYPGDNQTPWIGTCNIRSISKITQRHLDVRALVDIQIPLTSQNRPEFVGSIRNISAGGIYLVSQEALAINEQLSFSYAFRNIERPYVVEILWAQREGDEGFGYGCRFLDMTNGAESAVRNFVFGQLRHQAQEASRNDQKKALDAQSDKINSGKDFTV